MTNITRQLKRLVLVVAAVCLTTPAALLAQSMSSTNYKIPFDDLSGGGNYSTSTNYKLNDTISESATPSGEDLVSLNYKACAGFECLLTNSFLTVDIVTSESPCTGTTTGPPPHNIALGTLSMNSVTTASTHICVIIGTNVASSTVVTVRDSHGGIASNSVPADIITSNTATLSAGTEGYGICSTNTSGLTAVSPYNGSCDGSNHAVGALSTTAQTIFTTTGPVTSGFGDVLMKASRSSTTNAHDDYADTLTFVVTPTY